VTLEWTLWKSDGTDEGTVVVKEFDEGLGLAPESLTVVGDLLWFSGDDHHSGRELWKSDGSADGTLQVADFNRTGSRGSSAPTALIAHRGTLFFSSDDGVHGFELWRSDGTTDGTYQVADTRPGSASLICAPVSRDSSTAQWTSVGDRRRTKARRGLVIEGKPGARIGEVSTLGDIDGDGLADLVLGARLDDTWADAPGAVLARVEGADGRKPFSIWRLPGSSTIAKGKPSPSL